MKKILIIEDNQEMRENITEILELAHYSVSAAINGRQGVELAKKDVPDLIICDIMMPELDGYGVLYMLGKDPSTEGIPFIFLTAKAEKEDFRKGMSLGADDYLTKPFDEMELLSAVESRLKRSEQFKSKFGGSADDLDSFLGEASGVIELTDLAKDRKTRTFKKKETLFHEGDYPHSLFFINKGRVKTSKMNEDGKELVTEIIGTGEFLGYMPLMEDQEYNETATAIEETEVSIIPKEDFMSLIRKNRDVSHKFIRMLSNSVLDKETRLLRLAYGSVRERVAESLLILRERFQDNETKGMSFQISRDDLAGMVGTATESLIRTLSDFKEEKLIESKGRTISLLDPEKLRKVGRF